MNRYSRVFFVLVWLATASVFMVAAQTTKTLGRHECAVMQEHLQRQGYKVKVESGSLVTAGQNVWAILNVRKPDGTRDTYRYLLGHLDRQEVYEPGFVNDELY